MSHPLTPFFISLGSLGIRPMPADYVRIHLALSAGGRWTLGQLCDLLVALLVTDPEQERRFRLQFTGFFVQEKVAWQIPIDLDRALDDLRLLVGEDGAKAAPTPLTSIRPTPPRPPSRRWSRHRLQKLVGVLLLAGLIGGGVWWYREPLLNLFTTPEAPPPLPESHIAVPPPPPEPGADAPDTRQRRYEDVPHIEIHTHEKGWQGLLWGGAALLLLSAAALYGFWLWRRKPPPGKIDPSIRTGFRPGLIGGAPAPWLTRDALDHLADCLGYFRSENTGRVMDTDPTVRRTAAAGGVPVIAFEREKRLKHLLILEDLLTEARRWNPVVDELAQGLLARGVPVLRGSFRGVPDRFRSEEGNLHYLEDYADQRNGMVVLIFSDGTGVGREEALLLERVAGWPLVAWMELREPRAWDASTARIAALGFPLYPATEAGLRAAVEQLLSEQGSGSPSAHHPACWQGLPDPPDGEPTAEWLEKVLGDALSWAQACSRIMPPVSFGLADALRRSGLVGALPAQRLERLLTLPHTQYNAEGFRFAPPVCALLRAGYEERHTEEKRGRIHDLIQGMTRAAEPPDKTPTWRHLSWQVRYWFFELDAVQDARRRRAMHKLAEIRAGAMGGAVRQEIAAIRAPAPDPGDPVEQQLTRLVNGVPLRPPWGHRAACLLLAAGGLGCAYQAMGTLRWTIHYEMGKLGMDDLSLEAAGRWVRLSDVKAPIAITIRFAAFHHHPGPATSPLTLGTDHTVEIVLKSELRPCREELPDEGLTIVRCPPGEESKREGEPVYWLYSTWRQTLGEQAGEALLSIGLDIRQGKGRPRLTRLDHLLLETRAVDQLYVVQGDHSAAERALQRIQKEFAPWLARSQLVMLSDLWPNLSTASPAEQALRAGQPPFPYAFGKTLFLDTTQADNPIEVMTQRLWSWNAPILEEADLRRLPSAILTGNASFPMRLPAFKEDTEIEQRLAPVHELTAEQKRQIILAWKTGQDIELDDLHILTPRVAQILASWRPVSQVPKISLPGLQTISVEAARLLSLWRPKRPSALDLRAPANLDIETARILAAWRGNVLIFRDVQTLSPEAAQALAAWKGGFLLFRGMQSLSPEVVQSLARWNGNTLGIPDLKSLPPESIPVLRKWIVKSEQRHLLIQPNLLPPSTQTRLTVYATPSAAKVRILKIKEKYRPGISLKPSIYQVEVSHPGFITDTENVFMGWRDEEEVRITLRPKEP
ncbi:MAG: hypothetical protein H7837_14365 [Magnetococcus sp. MYC-9]